MVVEVLDGGHDRAQLAAALRVHLHREQAA
jgi:hypothetical protein